MRPAPGAGADAVRLVFAAVLALAGIIDHEGEVKIRMNTANYSDVLLIPNALKKDDDPKFSRRPVPRNDRDEMTATK